MPIDMPESVLVRFRGDSQPGITLRDLVNAIPYTARQQGLLTLDANGKQNVFSGRIIEIEGLPEHLTVEQAFELSDSTAERSAAGCTIRSPKTRWPGTCAPTSRCCAGSSTPATRTPGPWSAGPRPWSAGSPDPSLLRADPDADYAAVIEIDLAAITEPLLACPNDPDDVRPLSEVAGRTIDEVFIGSCMTNIGHFRAAGELLARASEPGRLPAVDRPADQDGRGPAAPGGLLRHLRRRRRPHRDSRLLALHGQPGPGPP